MERSSWEKNLEMGFEKLPRLIVLEGIQKNMSYMSRLEHQSSN